MARLAERLLIYKVLFSWRACGDCRSRAEGLKRLNSPCGAKVSACDWPHFSLEAMKTPDSASSWKDYRSGIFQNRTSDALGLSIAVPLT